MGNLKFEICNLKLNFGSVGVYRCNLEFEIWILDFGFCNLDFVI